MLKISNRVVHDLFLFFFYFGKHLFGSVELFWDWDSLGHCQLMDCYYIKGNSSNSLVDLGV